MPRDFEAEYIGLLHFLKEFSPVLHKIRDTSIYKREIDQYISFIDHEIAKGSNGAGR